MGLESRNGLTSGSLLRGLFKLAGPMFASALLQHLQSLIDLFWVGRLGSHAVAALALSGTVLMLMFPIVMGAATGTVALVSRAVGGGRLDDASEAAGQSLLVALCVGVATGLVGWAFCRPLCGLLGAEPDVRALAEQYLAISFLGGFTVFVLFVGTSALQGAGNTVLPMRAMLMANAINLVLDPLLIYGLLGLPRLGVQGAALATVFAQAAAAALIVVRLARGAAGLKVGLARWRMRAGLAWTLARIGLPSSAQMASRGVMSLVLMRIVAACGTAAVAGYGIGLRFHMLILMPAFVLGNAAATLVGQNLGAGQPRRAQSAAWLAAGLDVAIMAGSGALMLIGAPRLIAWFNGDPAVVRIGTAYLRTVSPAYVFVALAIVLGRALDGAGQTLVTMVCTILSLWGLQVPLAVGLSRVVTPPTQGIWWAIAAAMAVHGVMVAGWFMTGRWKAGPGPRGLRLRP